MTFTKTEMTMLVCFVVIILIVAATSTAAAVKSKLQRIELQTQIEEFFRHCRKVDNTTLLQCDTTYLNFK